MKQTTLFEQRLSFKDFSKDILESGDIDPDYIFLREKSKELKFTKEELFDWILHKLCIYNSISELNVILGKQTFENCKYGNERNKHKNQARGYYNNIRSVFENTDEIKEFFNKPGQEVFNNIKKIKGFGSWSAWKFMDLMSCVYGLEIDFNEIDFRKSYEFPLKGLLAINNYPENLKILKDDNVYNSCINNVKEICQSIDPERTPHNENKGIRMNEIETLLCKYHSYLHGHYYPGKDLKHLQKNIEEYV